MGKNIQKIAPLNTLEKDLTMKQMFDKCEKLISEQSEEIC